MERQYKKSYKLYSAWNYELEIEDLNKASAEGWQLIKGGAFFSKFKRNPDIQYRYQLDYRPNIEDVGRYIETYREQGWEYINSTFNGWNYFRKLYDPALPESQYEIFTDRSSIAEMNNRWAKLAIGLSIFYAIYLCVLLAYFIWQPKLPTLVQFILHVVILIVVIRAICIMKNPDKSKSNRKDGIILTLFFASIIANAVISIGTVEARPHFNTVYAGEEIAMIPAALDEALSWYELEIKYSDNYYLDLKVDTASPITFSVVNEAGETIYTLTEQSFEKENLKLYLKRGNYTLYLSDFAGGRVNFTFEID